MALPICEVMPPGFEAAPFFGAFFYPLRKFLLPGYHLMVSVPPLTGIPVTGFALPLSDKKRGADLVKMALNG